METQPDKVIVNFRLSLKQVIDDILTYIPNTGEYTLLRHDLNNVKGSINYTAPERLADLAYKAYGLLVRYLPLNTEDDTQNPQWIKNIRDRWNTYEEKKKINQTKKYQP